MESIQDLSVIIPFNGFLFKGYNYLTPTVLYRQKSFLWYGILK